MQLSFNDLRPRAIPVDYDEQQQLATEQARHAAWGVVVDAIASALATPSLPSADASRLRSLLGPCVLIAERQPELALHQGPSQNLQAG